MYIAYTTGDIPNLSGPVVGHGMVIYEPLAKPEEVED